MFWLLTLWGKILILVFSIDDVIYMLGGTEKKEENEDCMNLGQQISTAHDEKSYVIL